MYKVYVVIAALFIGIPGHAQQGVATMTGQGTAANFEEKIADVQAELDALRVKYLGPSSPFIRHQDYNTQAQNCARAGQHLASLNGGCNPDNGIIDDAYVTNTGRCRNGYTRRGASRFDGGYRWWGGGSPRTYAFCVR